ncbi:MAG TPA: tetratricopeptide repeat protein [Longimicrobium sp.]
MLPVPESTLRPLRGVAGDISALRGGTASPGALVRVARAAESTLRRVLRDDPTAPVELRLRALSPDDLSTDELLAELRRRDRLSLELAAGVHELGAVAARVSEGAEPSVRDFEMARTVADGLERHLLSAPAAPAPLLEDPVLAEEAEAPIPAHDDATRVHTVPRDRGRRPLAFLAGAAGIAAIVLLAAWAVSGNRGGDLERADRLVREGKIATAAQELREYANARPEDPEGRLRLAAVYREAGRREDALKELRAGLVSHTEDAGLNSELGHLLLDSGKPLEAVRAFRLAIKSDRENERAWVGLVRALREAGLGRDAEQAREGAPVAVRELVPRALPEIPAAPAATPQGQLPAAP